MQGRQRARKARHARHHGGHVVELPWHENHGDGKGIDDMQATADGRGGDTANDQPAPVVVGIDPGGRDTGIVAISPDGTVRTAAVTNPGELLPLPAGYLADVLAAVAELVAGRHAIIRVEDVKRPNWHVAKDAKRGAATNPTGLLATAQVLGAIRAVYRNAELVPPGGNGSKPLGAYPLALVGDRERTTPGWELKIGQGKKRHLRSAWDIANYSRTTPKTRTTHVSPLIAEGSSWTTTSRNDQQPATH